MTVDKRNIKESISKNVKTIKFVFFPILYLSLIGFHIALVWGLAFFPTQDGPSHIYNLVILKDLINGGKIWGDFYYYDLNFFPNLGFHIISYPMLYFFNPITVERIFLTIYILMISFAVPLFIHEFNKKALYFSFLVFPVIFNFPLMMGFYSYVVSVPLFILFFCLSWKLRFKKSTELFIYYNLMGLILLMFHLIGFCIFMMAIFSIFLTRLSGDNWFKKILRYTIIMSPSIIVFGCYYLKINDSPGRFEYLSVFNRWGNLFADLFFFTSIKFAKLEILSAVPFSIVVFFCLFVFFREKSYDFGELKKEPSNQAPLIHFFLFMLVVYFLSPSNLGDGAFFNLRLPFVILLTILPLLKIPDKIIFKRGILIIVPLISFFSCFTNAVSFYQESKKVELYTAGLGVEIPEKSILMSYKIRKPGFTIIDVLLHAVSYYGLEKKCVDIGNYEARTRLFPVRLKKKDDSLPNIHEIEWEVEKINTENYALIDYLISWQLESKHEKKIRSSYRMIFQNSDLKIWMRKAQIKQYSLL